MTKKTATFLRNIGLCVLATLLFAAHAFAQDGIWISAKELASLPTSGKAWDAVKAKADAPLPCTPNLSARCGEGLFVLARGLVYARIGGENYRTEVVNAVMTVIGTEGSDALGTFRALGTYTIAADLVGLPANEDQTFRAWLRQLLDPKHAFGGKSLIECHEERPNNWGTHCGASRTAIAVYLGDTAELARTAQIFKGWLGDRSSYAGFKYGDLIPSWQCDLSQPVGINPKGCTKDGHSIDGVLPDDMRRSGPFTWPPPKQNYVYGALQGALAQAVILYRRGYDVWNWEDQALRRAFDWLHEQANYPPAGDDNWEPHIINHYYGTNFPAPVPSSLGKNMAYTDWTHGTDRGASPGVDETPPSPPTGLSIN